MNHDLNRLRITCRGSLCRVLLPFLTGLVAGCSDGAHDGSAIPGASLGGAAFGGSAGLGIGGLGMGGGGLGNGGMGAGGSGIGGLAAGGTSGFGVGGGLGATGGLESGTGGVPSAGGATAGVGGLASGGVGTGGSASGGTGGGSMGGASGGAGAAAGITLFIAGDSTVANGNTPCPTGWGKHLAEQFNENVSVVNSAAGGRSVRTWLYSVTNQMDGTGECVMNLDASGERVLQERWQAMLDTMSPGDYLFVQFGINDGSATCDRHVGLEAFKDEYGMMAQAARERGAEPIFLTPVSAIACNGDTARGTRGGYVTATLEAGTEYGVPVIDLHQLSVDLYDSLGFCPIPGGDVSATTTGPVGDFFCDDHTHFSDAGAVVMAGLVAQAIRNQGLPLSAYLK